MAEKSNRWQNSAPEYFAIFGDEDKADVTTIKKNLPFLRACSTSPAVMMKHSWELRTPFTSTFSTTPSLEHSRSNPHLSRSTDRIVQPSCRYFVLTVRMATASTSLFSSGSPKPPPPFDCLVPLAPLRSPCCTPAGRSARGTSFRKTDPCFKSPVRLNKAEYRTERAAFDLGNVSEARNLPKNTLPSSPCSSGSRVSCLNEYQPNANSPSSAWDSTTHVWPGIRFLA